MLRSYSNHDDKEDMVSREKPSADTGNCGDDTEPRSRNADREKGDEEPGLSPSNGHCTGVDNGFGEPQTVEKNICTHELHTAPIGKVLQALESSRDTYAGELLRLKAINEAISPNRARAPTRDLDMQTFGPTREGPLQSTGCDALLEKLSQEKDDLQKQLEEQRTSCTNVQRQLEQEREEKLEAQNYVNMMNETVTAALNGEKFLVEQHKHLLTDQQNLAAKFGSISKIKLTGFREHLDELESVCCSVQQKEEVSVLHNKLCIHGLSIGVQFVLFCHAMFIFLSRVLNAGHIYAPT